jgi:hypothetical protein
MDLPFGDPFTILACLQVNQPDCLPACLPVCLSAYCQGSRLFCAVHTIRQMSNRQEGRFAGVSACAGQPPVCQSQWVCFEPYQRTNQGEINGVSPLEKLQERPTMLAGM